MPKVWVTLENTDKIEGRGALVPDAVFAYEQDARNYVIDRDDRAQYVHHYIQGFELQTSYERKHITEARRETIRANALRKLTPEERQVLGVTDV